MSWKFYMIWINVFFSLSKNLEVIRRVTSLLSPSRNMQFCIEQIRTLFSPPCASATYGSARMCRRKNTAVHGPVWVDSYGRLHLLQWTSFILNDSPATVGWDPVTVWFCLKTETAQTPMSGPGRPLYPGGSGPPLRRPAGRPTGRVADESDALHDGSPKRSGMPSWQTTAPIRGLTGTELVG